MKKTTGKSNQTSGQLLNPKGSWFGGLLRFLFLPFWLAYVTTIAIGNYFWRAPFLIKIVMAVSVLGLTGLGAMAARSLIQTRRSQNIYLLQIEFQSAAIKSDEEQMLDVLQKIAVLQPKNQFIKNRIEAVKTGIANEDDSDMCMLMARVHARHKRMAESTREAKKRLVQEPNDWLCNCIIAQEYLRKNEPDEAKPYLERVGNVDTAISKPDLGMIMHAIELRQIVGLDNADLRGFILTRVLPNLRNANLEQVKPDGKIQIIYTYISATMSIPETSLDSTLQYWALASKLADLTVPEAIEEKNVACLKQFGVLQIEMQNCVFRYQKAGKVNAEIAAKMYAEVDVRGLAAWTAVRDLKPDDPAGYAGLGGYLVKAKKMDEAEKVVIEGINTTGPHPELLRLLIILDEKKGNSDRALNFAMLVAKKNPDNPNVWRVLIDAAKLANRRDVAIQACQEMRKSKAGLAFPDMAEGILWLETGDSHKALECLNRVDEKLRMTEPAVVQAYIKAMINSGNEVRIPDYVTSIIQSADLKNQPNLALACAQGLSEANMTGARADFLVVQLDRILARWPSNRETVVDGKWLRAEAMYKAAELSTPRWEPARLERAFRQYEAMKFEFGQDPRSFIRLAQLQLDGLKKPADALITVEELVKLPNLSIEARNISGAVYVANQKFDAAIAILEPVTKSPQVSAYPLTQLAKAYLGKGDAVLAKTTLRQATYHKMTDRERDDYREAALAIIRE